MVELVTNVEDATACRDIDEDACRWVSGNFGIYLIAHTLTKLGDALSNPKTVITWLMVSVGAPTALIAMLVPIRESGSMLPQLFLGAWVRTKPLRKPIWILSSLLQAASVLGCAAAAAFLSGMTAGAAIVGCVIAFSLARSLNSIASKDIVGKTIPKGRRGTLSGWASGISGLLVLATGVWLTVRGRGEDGPAFYGALLAAAGSLWIVASLVFSALKETPGETGGGKDGWKEAIGRLDLMRSDAAFRRFVITRALLMCSALSAPFYVVLARQNGDGGAATLGSFLVANGLAASLSAPLWGRAADRSSRSVMITAALVTSGLGIGAFLLLRVAPSVASSAWIFPLFFFGLGVAHSGVRAGRKTYLVDLAGGVKRTDYVSVSNTLIGFLLLVAGGITSLFSGAAPEVIILGLSVMGLLGAGMATGLPEVE